LWNKAKEAAMNEGTSMKDGPGTGEAAGLDAQGAAVIAQEARERARRELRVSRPVLFLTWGLVVLVSYGAMWLSVRGQHPYHGPAWETLLLAFLLFVAAAGAPANVVDRAASGVGGRSELQRGIFALALVAGSPRWRSKSKRCGMPVPAGRWSPCSGRPSLCWSRAWSSPPAPPSPPGWTGPGSPWACGCWRLRPAVPGQAR
jgi:hypothetical protein